MLKKDIITNFQITIISNNDHNPNLNSNPNPNSSHN